MKEPKRQLIRGNESEGYSKVCQCCGSTSTPYACAACRSPLCTSCADVCGCPRCDLTDEGFAPDCKV